jgi:predicted TIM-barrel fold metal-dependent hydrolase
MTTIRLASSPWGPLRVCDAHVHFLSHRLTSMLAGQAGKSFEAAVATLGWEAPPEDPAALAARWVADLDRHHIARAALIASIPGDEGSVVCAAAAHPARFRGFMMVNPAADRAAENAAAVLAGGNIHALCLFPALHGVPLSDARSVALVEAAAAHSAAVFVHCGALSIGFRMKLGLPGATDMTLSNPLAVHPLAQRFPGVPFILPHFGAGLLREALMLADLCPNVYLDTSSSNRWMRYEGSHCDLREVFRRALEVAGPHRLLFGTDSSFFPRGWHASIFEIQSRALYEIGVNEEDAGRIFSGNFDTLFPAL